MKTSRYQPTRTHRDQNSRVRRCCGERPGRKALGRPAERISRASFLPAFLESLSGGAGTAVCYPTLEKTLQWGGRKLKAFFSIIQHPELPAARMEPEEGPGQSPRAGSGWAGGRAGCRRDGQPGLHTAWACSCPSSPMPPALGCGVWRGGSRAWAGLELSPSLRTQTVLWNGGGGGLAQFPEPRWGVWG